jgi:hypothetical protein
MMNGSTSSAARTGKELHRTTLTLKNVLTISINSVASRAQFLAQTKTTGLPILYRVGDLTAEKLRETFDYFLRPEASEQARPCGERARQVAGCIHDDGLLSAFIAGNEPLP